MNARAALALLRSEEHLSASAINTFLLCPRQHAHRYLLGTPPTHRSAPLAFGSAAHRALALHYRTLMQTNAPPTSEELAAAFSDAWHDELKGDIPVLLDDKETANTLLDKGVSLLRTFHAEAERPRRVVAVEEPFSVQLDDLGESLDARFVGVLDAVVQDESGKHCILEHKTASRRWSKDRQATDLQVTGYGVAARLVGFGQAEVRVQLLLKTREPALEVLHLHRTNRDRDDFLATVVGVARAIGAGVTYPVRGWQCRSCPFAGVCIAG